MGGFNIITLTYIFHNVSLWRLVRSYIGDAIELGYTIKMTGVKIFQ